MSDIFFYDHNLSRLDASCIRIPNTDKLHSFQVALNGRAITIETLDDIAKFPSGLVVAHAEGAKGLYGVDALSVFAIAHPTFRVLLVSSRRSTFTNQAGLPPNIRASRLTYHEMEHTMLADTAENIRSGDPWDEKSPLLKPPLMASVIALYMLFVASQAPPTYRTRRELFIAAASELANRGSNLDPDAITQEHLERVLQAEYK